MVAKLPGAIKLVIFDWDGTLIDSEAHIVNSLRHAATAMGFHLLAHHAYAGVIGLAMDRALRVLYPEMSVEQLEEFKVFYRDHFYGQENGSVKPFSGVESVLQALKKQGYLLAVATGKGVTGLERALDHTGFRKYFDAYRCSETTASKPDPQMLLEILEELNVGAKESVMVGDTIYDLEMAQHAGMKKIAVSFGVHGVDKLRKFHPDAVVDDLSEMVAVITNW